MTDIPQRVDAIITMDMSGKAKPSPELFLLAMTKMGATASATYMRAMIETANYSYNLADSNLRAQNPHL